jgi:hypothetical protein
MVKKRCIRCRQHVRDDGTCQNQKCVLYVPEVQEEEPVTEPVQKEPADEK